MPPKNNWRQKKELDYYDGHNRQPGKAAFWKSLKSRNYRRHGAYINRKLVDQQNDIKRLNDSPVGSSGSDKPVRGEPTTASELRSHVRPVTVPKGYLFVATQRIHISEHFRASLDSSRLSGEDRGEEHVGS